MIKIDALEAALKRMKEHEPTWMPADVVRAYRDSVRTGNEFLDINKIDWDVEDIIPTLKEVGITEFTLSESSTSTMTILNTLTMDGARIEGMTTVNAPYHDSDDNWERIPAVKLILM